MRRIAANCALLILWGVLLLGRAEAGWVIHSRSTGMGGMSEKEVIYFQRDQVREESGDRITVMDFAARKIIMADSREKTYSVMTFDEFKKLMRDMMKKAGEAMEELRRQGLIPPGAPGQAAGKVTVTRIAGETVAGYPCEGYRVSVGGTAREEIWVTKKVDPTRELGPAVWKEFEELSREAKKMGLSVDEMEDASAYQKIFESGYPMKIVTKPYESVHEVTLVEKKAVPASLFVEPKGYRKVPYEQWVGGAESTLPGAGGAPADPREGMPAEYGRQTGEEAKEAASPGAQEPGQEKKGEMLDNIREGAREGIRKLFKW